MQGHVAQTQPSGAGFACFGCGEEGHILALCPNKATLQAANTRIRAPQQGQQTTLTCFTCGKKGHLARNCPQHNRAVANVMDAKDKPMDYPVMERDHLREAAMHLNRISLKDHTKMIDYMDEEYLGEDFPSD